MLFNSIEFLVFFVVFFAAYWAIPRPKIGLQNALVLLASYCFYGWWDYRFLLLIAASTLVDYSIGKRLGNALRSDHRRALLFLSLAFNLGLLAYFKYANFFLDSLYGLIQLDPSSGPARSLNIILPVGISFYTFQTLSYTIDIYRKKLAPRSDFIAFAAYVSFFPQLVAGPIERASNLLPQFEKKRVFDYAKAVDGCRQILWGLFKKIVVADGCALLVDQVYGQPELDGPTYAIATLLFSIQIYGDFSGYSDIAIGLAKLLGFDLMVNFRFPYFSRDIAEFWRRWHISLSTWFRDYLYIPLGGSRSNRWTSLRNIALVFLVSGLWHGANWTFVAWGGFHAILFLPLYVGSKNRRYLDGIAVGRVLPKWREAMAIATTFCMATLAWVWFRADSIEHAMSIYQQMALDAFQVPAYKAMYTFLYWNGDLVLIPMLAVLLLVDWNGRNHDHPLRKWDQQLPRWSRWVGYAALSTCVLYFSSRPQSFIYFQF